MPPTRVDMVLERLEIYKQIKEAILEKRNLEFADGIGFEEKMICLNLLKN